MTINLDALEAVARAATPGVWKACEQHVIPRVELENRDEVAEVSLSLDAEHIAAFDPPTALALIAELRQEREQAAEASHAAGRHKSDAAYWENEYETAEDMKAELRAELRRARECIEKVREWSVRNGYPGASGDHLHDILTTYDQEGAS